MSGTTEETTLQDVSAMGSYDETWLRSEAARQYEGSSPCPKLAKGRKALLVVDMIDAFVRPNWSPNGVRPRPSKFHVWLMSSAFRRANTPAIFTGYGRPEQVAANRPASFYRAAELEPLRGHSAAILYRMKGYTGHSSRWPASTLSTGQDIRFSPV
jgi:hypothetical protein